MSQVDLLTAEDVALMLGMSVAQVKRRTTTEHWPCVRFSQKVVRYRLEHVEAIIAMHEQEARPLMGVPGQTKRSRSRWAG